MTVVNTVTNDDELHEKIENLLEYYFDGAALAQSIIELVDIDRAKAVLDGQISVLHKVQTIRKGEAASNNVIAYHLLEELTGLQTKRKALDK